MKSAVSPTPFDPRVQSGEPLVSIVVVCYNQAHYLQEAIESALAQTYMPMQILLVDDGSTDETAAVCARYPSVRYIHQENRGLAAARNIGLAFAIGEYVLFLDADDKLLPDAVRSGLECFEEFSESAFVSGSHRKISSDGMPIETEAGEFIEADHYRRLLEGNYIGMHATVLYRRAILASAGGFDESLRACEDYEIYLRIARRWQVSAHRKLVAEYRQHDTNMSRDRAFMLKSVLQVLDKERDRIPDRYHLRALQRGRHVWREYYGPMAIEQWRGTPRIRALVRLLRLCPRQTLRHAGSFLRRRIKARRVRFGTLRSLAPVSRQFGFDRGLPIDRYYIESFLSNSAEAIRGVVLEIGDDSYSRRFGAARITGQEILHIVPGHPGATIIADLADAPEIPSNSFDCIILTQTMHYIFDLHEAAETLYRILKPGGTLLATLPGISAICRDQDDKESDCWRFTAASARRLFAVVFGDANVRVRTYGNVLTAFAFLQGLCAGDLRQDEMDHLDPDYQVIIAVAAYKAGG
jgi:hypothetical protein